MSIVSSFVRRPGFSMGAVAALVLAGAVAISAPSAGAQQEPLIPGTAEASSTIGTARCDATGVFRGGRIQGQLSGQANAAGDAAATNLTCQLLQGGEVVAQANSTRGGRLTGASVNFDIAVKETQLCASGFVVGTDGTAANPFDPKVVEITPAATCID
jgi:hypothetical protein